MKIHMVIRASTLAVLLLAMAACRKPEAAAPAAATPLSEAAAAKIADATVASWLSMDVAKIKALYAPTIDGFDYAAAGLAGDRATWDKRQDGFAAAKLDGATQKERKIQILDADTFVVSGIWDLTSSTIPANGASFRCTDVYEKDAAGTWPIINEHCSLVPKG